MSSTRLVLSAAALLALAGPTYAAATPSEGVRVIDGADSVMVRRNRLLPWRALAANARVPAAAEVRCDKPCRLQVDADNTVTLMPGAVIAVGDFFYVPLVPGAASLVPAHQIELKEGLIEASSPSEHSLPLVISVDDSEHVAIRAAHVQVSQMNDHLSVGVINGRARVGASRAWITVEKGQGTTVTPHSRPHPAGPLLPPPEWLPSGGSCQPSLSMTVQGELAAVGGCWKAVAENASYRVELARDPEFRSPVGPGETVAVTSWSKILPVGRYFARASTIDPNGISGQSSVTRQLVVIAYGLPPGATANMDKHLLVIPEGREVTFGDTSGLELAVDKGGFSRAPSAIRMDAEAEHELRLRLKDDPSVVSAVHLTRRALKADVRITPKMAQWPRDPIEISVTIEDPSGQMDPSKVEAQLTIMLGLTELTLVKWTHEGAVWSARVDPRNTGGPTVLRVIARDEFGTQIGRNFLEIVHKPQKLTFDDGQPIANN